MRQCGMCSGKLLERVGLIGYDIIPRDAVKNPVDNVEEKIK